MLEAILYLSLRAPNQMNAAQILPYAAAAGFTGDDLVTAVAVALAESSGNPSAYDKEPQDVPGRYGRSSANDGKGSYGLMQIYLAAHPEFAGWNLADPQINLNAAYSIYQHRGFADWATYPVLYQKYVSTVLAALPTPPPLTLDASTGLPVSDTVMPSTSPDAFYASAVLPPPSTDGLSVGKVLLWAAVGLAALWIFEEAT